MRLIQYLTDSGARGVARIEGNRAIAVPGATRMIDLAKQAIAAQLSLDEAVQAEGDGAALAIRRCWQRAACFPRSITRMPRIAW